MMRPMMRPMMRSMLRSALRSMLRSMLRSFLPVPLLALLAAPSLAAQKPNPHIVLHTQLGDIELELDAVHAPISTANFLRYVDAGFYQGGLFHRTVTSQNQPNNLVRIEVIQAGVQPQHERDAFPPIALERTSKTGLHHLNGTLSMARDLPDSATTDFFICIGDQPELDYGGKRNPDGQGFAAFGHVVQGMNVVHSIQTAPANGQTLNPPIKILTVSKIAKYTQRFCPHQPRPLNRPPIRARLRNPEELHPSISLGPFCRHRFL
jgi:peptidyl-prolyl cis-trans isomerase A (cyclophilin A)